MHLPILSYGPMARHVPSDAAHRHALLLGRQQVTTASSNSTEHNKSTSSPLGGSTADAWIVVSYAAIEVCLELGVL